MSQRPARHGKRPTDGGFEDTAKRARSEDQRGVKKQHRPQQPRLTNNAKRYGAVQATAPKVVELENSDEEVEEETVKQESQVVPVVPVTASQPTSSRSSSSLLDKYRKKLEGAKFRMLNESLYTGEKAATGLTQNEFEAYHQGFTTQVEKWPTNPVEVIIQKYLTHPRKKKMTIGDFGCGDAKIAKVMGKIHKIYSYDLVAANESVVARDIAKEGVPLDDETLDMVIFSLSLMGSDVTEYVLEARRVLRFGGTLIIAEVKSRFSDDGEKSADAMHKGLSRFCSQLTQLGFKLQEMDSETNTMFVLLRLVKGKPSAKDAKANVKVTLKSCQYKRR